ncbi:MAG: lysophospholipid acyltransferase family protein [Thiobacillus sp.]|nr:lysophospholipid acyltransferase family protein [Thiobacillus sp.]
MIALLKLLARLPLPVLHGLGIALGWIVYFSPGRHSGRMRRNIASSGLCVPGHACWRLQLRAIGESGKSIAELMAVWLRPYPGTLKLVKGATGLDHFEAALSSGRGVVLMSPHIGCFEIISLYVASRHPFTAMYKPPRDRLLAQLMRMGRERGQARLVPADLSGVRAQFAALKRGEAIGILPDQVASSGDGVWAPFFGRPAYTPTLAASLQRKTQAAAFFVVAERLAWGRGYQLHFRPFGGALPADKAEAAACINHEIEAIIRRFPTQYMWTYNRYKRPGGVAEPAS